MICAQRPHIWAHPTFIVMFKELVKILPKDGRPAATYGQGHISSSNVDKVNVTLLRRFRF
jgi:hypothetical protein